jgi:transcriptional regulator with XRE-family HTH domain
MSDEFGGDPLARDFGHELEQLLVDLEVSVRALSERTGINRTYLSDLIHGRRGQRGPSPTIVERIAAALEVKPDHFRITRARVVLEHPKAVDAVYTRIAKR